MGYEEIEFEVVFASSEKSIDIDDDTATIYRGLLQEKSWISTKYCNFPQELILKLKAKSRLERVQIMSHHSYVPHKVELCIGSPRSDALFLNAKFDKIGTVEFKDTGHREKQSLYPDAKSQFVKLIIHENHENREQNPFNQVGLTEVNIGGYYIREDNDDRESRGSATSASRRKSPKRNRSSQSNRSSNSKSGDKTFTAEMRQIIKILEHEKKKAIRDENFTYAKKAKHAIHRLKETVEEVDKLESDKREAIEEENFDKAQDLKDEIRSLRTAVYAEIGLRNLLEHNEEIMREINDETLFDDDVPIDRTYKNNGSHRPPSKTRDRPSSNTGSYKRPLSKSQSNAFSKKENTVLPTIERRRVSLSESEARDVSDVNKLPTISFENDKEDIVTEEPSTIKSTIDLSPNDRNQLAPAIKSFGIKPVEMAYSKKWEQRKESLSQLKAKLEATSGKSQRDAARLIPPAILLINKALRDKVFAVYKAALDVLEYLCTTYITENKLVKGSGNTIAKRTYETLIIRTGDTVNDKRFRIDTLETVIKIINTADLPVAKSYAAFFLKPFEATSHAKIDQGHTAIVEKVADETGAPNKNLGIDENAICMFAMSCLLHTDSEVRYAGVRLMLRMYRNGNKNVVLEHLPPPASKTVLKNPLFRSLYDELNKIDGDQTKTNSDTDSLNRTHEADNGHDEKIESGHSNNNTRRGSLVNLNHRRRSSLTDLTGYDGASQSGAGGRRSSIPPPNTRRRGSRGENDVIDKTCVFCGEVNQKFMDDTIMDKHYLRVCPMLKKCENCNEMVEIATLKIHYLTECPTEDQYKECQRCKEPIENKNFDAHNKARKCQG